MSESMPRRTFWSLLAFLFAARLSGASLPDPAPFDAVLSARARQGGFDYAGASGQDKKRLAAYMANLGDADPAKMSPDERKAFYINAYNAAAITTVLEKYPTKSILDVDGAFQKVVHRVGGEMMTLDAIENKLREDKDSRIHFAIVCASKSCPPLAAKAYVPATLNADLDRQAKAFVNDASRNQIDRGKGRVALSKIFFWNRKEFERDAGGSLLRGVAKFVADPAAASWLGASPKDPEFLEYDWALNQP
ncbi:MAG: DUF547 domain-containing protein [Acidobacteriota bacterium]